MKNIKIKGWIAAGILVILILVIIAGQALYSFYNHYVSAVNYVHTLGKTKNPCLYINTLAAINMGADRIVVGHVTYVRGRITTSENHLWAEKEGEKVDNTIDSISSTYDKRFLSYVPADNLKDFLGSIRIESPHSIYDLLIAVANLPSGYGVIKGLHARKVNLIKMERGKC